VHAHEKLKSDAREKDRIASDLEEAARAGEKVALILHYSIDSPLNDIFKKAKNVSRALIYHNLTPERWYYSYNPRVVKDLERGREELPELLKLVDLPLADSEFNRQELSAFGCKRAEVLPLLIDSAKWSVASNPGIRGVLKGHGGTNILHVGRFAPNKCVEDIIKAFYFYHHKIEQKSKLWLIGSDIDTEIYSFELRMLITELRLREAVEIVGQVADTELRAFYENADTYLCMSEHEGFCVPLIEAMHFGCPVVAFDSSAVSETLGSAGLLLRRKSPAEVAELIHLVNTDRALRSELIARGHKRAAEFGESFFIKQLTSVLLEPLDRLAAPDTRQENVYSRA
jgi:glycosyltransferase involved in cell wall biosynthesis